MNDSSDSIQKIIHLAELALDPNLSVDESIHLIEEYSDAFAEMFSVEEPQEGAENPYKISADVSQESLQKLDRLHSAILRKAEGFKKTTSDDMISLQKRGKGLMTYIDTLPKSISQRKPKKG